MTALFEEFSLTFKRHLILFNHDILLAKLGHHGTRGLTKNWLSSFLKNRTQYVYLDGHCSTTKQATCGVPQGLTLGPLLFLV